MGTLLDLGAAKSAGFERCEGGGRCWAGQVVVPWWPLVAAVARTGTGRVETDGGGGLGYACCGAGEEAE